MQINRELGVEITELKIIFDSNRVAAEEPESEGQGILSPQTVSLMRYGSSFRGQ